MSEQERVEKAQPTEPSAHPPQTRPFAGWLFAEATIGLSVFSIILCRAWSRLHWLDPTAKMSESARLTIGELFDYLAIYRIFGLLAVGVFLVGLFFKPRRASLVALPFALMALLIALFRQ